MHIILRDQITNTLEEKYIILELDIFHVIDKDSMLPAYCLIENIPLHELPEVENFRYLHAQLIKNYRKGNWEFCEDALRHLLGRWNGDVDSFYQELMTRIIDLRVRQVDIASWDPAIKI